MATGSVRDRALFKKFSWHYAIFDEGHMLKNMTSMRYRTLSRIKVCAYYFEIYALVIRVFSLMLICWEMPSFFTPKIFILP
jgi:SWI/SNF-related matrix-associated actin-dependent regulator 1 of chromatin subfamily A